MPVRVQSRVDPADQVTLGAVDDGGGGGLPSAALIGGGGAGAALGMGAGFVIKRRMGKRVSEGV